MSLDVVEYKHVNLQSQYMCGQAVAHRDSACFILHIRSEPCAVSGLCAQGLAVRPDVSELRMQGRTVRWLKR